MGSITRLDLPQDLSAFLEFIYGDQTGYAYSPTKNPDPDNPVFEQFFFEWPTGKDELIDHIQAKTSTHEVYFSPALFKTNQDAEKENFLGTNVVWVEFDGNDPANVTDTPEPVIKLQSSVSKHEHWYWKLDKFVTDIDTLEDITKRLTYHLNADMGCWNANRVLRPPGTRHHESGLMTTTLYWVPQVTSIRAFNDLPQVPIKILQEQDINHIPQALEVIAKYSWANNQEDFKFFMTPKIEQGHRSSALAKLGHICVELGMTNPEVLSLLLNADSRWGKFAKRKDQKSRLLGIINYCRSRHPVGQVEEKTSEPEIKEPRLKVYHFGDFIDTPINFEWLVEGLIHKKGFGIISGPPDVGKSQFTIRLAEKLARGERFLQWMPSRPLKILLVSMEMPHEELLYLMENMHIERTEVLHENMLVMPLGYSLRLGNKAAQAELAAVVDEYRPDGIIFDSLSVGVSDDLNSDKIMLDVYNYVHEVLRAHFSCFVWFIHHNRKAQIGNKKPNKLEDLYGSVFIGTGVTTGVLLWPGATQGTIEVNCLKLRMAKHFDKFFIKRTSDLDFQLLNSSTVQAGNTKTEKTDQIFSSGMEFDL